MKGKNLFGDPLILCKEKIFHNIKYSFMCKCGVNLLVIGTSKTPNSRCPACKTKYVGAGIGNFEIVRKQED